MTLGEEALSLTVCSACGSHRARPSVRSTQDCVTGESFQVLRCSDCGAGFTQPRPKDLDPYYPASYRRYGRLTWWVLRALYRRRVRSWIHSVPDAGTAVEIGCGDGSMLRALRDEGWRVVGIERDVRAAAASRAYGVPVFVGDLDAVRGAAADLVLLFQTLEHFAEPDAVLRRCAEICRPGARLIVAVPNFNSWQARLFAGAWFHLDAPRHLTHFSRHSLTYLLRRVGFEPEHVRFVSWEHDPFGWIQSTLNILRFPKNLLTRSLIQWDWLAFANPRGVAMLVTTCILVIPALVLAPLSWLTGAGAIIEIRAVRR